MKNEKRTKMKDKKVSNTFSVILISLQALIPSKYIYSAV
jgi:hypothetical protein